VSKLQVGDLLRYRKGDHSYLTVGKCYEVLAIDDDDRETIEVIDDDGDRIPFLTADFERSIFKRSLGASLTQVSGSHYSKLSIQPIDYIVKNSLSYMQGNVIKYITRYKDKNGLEDLRKAKHYIDLIIEQEYGDGE